MSKIPAPGALFLDRDGVINEDLGYVGTTDRFHFREGIFEVLRHAREIGLRCIVVTNQSGIGRGMYTSSEFEDLTRWMVSEIGREGGEIAQVYHCPYHPQASIDRYRADHPWRKPRPGMILQGLADFGLAAESCAMLGDKPSDMAAAKAAGLGLSILLDACAASRHEPFMRAQSLRQVSTILDRWRASLERPSSRSVEAERLNHD